MHHNNEILISDILKRANCELGDISDLRLLWNDVNELKKRIEIIGKQKCGNNKFKNTESDNIEKLIINIILRWRVLKLGI